MSELRAEVTIHLIPTESGGRTAPVYLGDPRFVRYYPHLRVIGGSSEMLGIVFIDGPKEPTPPGGSVHATIEALYESTGVSYDELVEGARFEIVEGPFVVGYGEVVRRLN